MKAIRRSAFGLLALATTTLISPSCLAVPAEPVGALAKLPVKEITVFKDGNAFLLHEGDMPTDAKGNVVMDYLPTPVLGTFWPFLNDQGARLSAVKASKHRVSVSRTALDVGELLEANPGAGVKISELVGTGERATVVSYDATILGVPTQSSDELEKTSPPNEGEQLPRKGSVILLKTVDGTKTVPIDRIETVTFKEDHKTHLSNEEFRNLLTLELDWPKHHSESQAQVGLMYLQNGLQWAPSYKIELLDDGKAKVKLEATVDNEITDFSDVTANLVIGVPSFNYKGKIDPIALGQWASDLLKMEPTVINERQYSAGRVFRANAMAVPAPAGLPMEEAVEVSGSSKNEDLFVYTVKHLSLKKGERTVVPVTEFELPYKDLYELELPIVPPRELLALNPQASEFMRRQNTPNVSHEIQLNNTSQVPLTSAPALILHNNQVIAQGTMTYAAPGADEKLDVTSALDLKIKKTEKEIDRSPNALKLGEDKFLKVGLEGTIAISNFGTKTASLEVKRRIIGKAEKADHHGVIEQVNVFEDNTERGGIYHPILPTYIPWPNWWSSVNGIGTIKWNFELEPQKSIDLNYRWSYYWR